MWSIGSNNFELKLLVFIIIIYGYNKPINYLIVEYYKMLVSCLKDKCIKYTLTRLEELVLRISTRLKICEMTRRVALDLKICETYSMV